MGQLLIYLRALIRHSKIIVVVRLGETKPEICTLLDYLKNHALKSDHLGGYRRPIPGRLTK